MHCLLKQKQVMSHAADFIIKYGLYRRLLGIKNAFSEEDDLVMLDDLEACNNYQLDLTELKSSRNSYFNYSWQQR